jgi:hypothetical protein
MSFAAKIRGALKCIPLGNHNSNEFAMPTSTVWLFVSSKAIVNTIKSDTIFLFI